MFDLVFFEDPKDEYLETLEACGLPVDSNNYWFVRHKKRAVEELFKMQENTNSTVFCRETKLIWEVDIINEFGSYFLISIETNANYPFTAPKVYLKDPELEDGFAKHVYKDKSLCLFHPDEYSSSMSILDIRNIAASWLHCYEIYLETKVWRAAEAD